MMAGHESPATSLFLDCKLSDAIAVVVKGREHKARLATVFDLPGQSAKNLEKFLSAPFVLECVAIEVDFNLTFHGKRPFPDDKLPNASPEARFLMRLVFRRAWAFHRKQHLGMLLKLCCHGAACFVRIL